MSLPAFAKHGVPRRCCLPHYRALAQRPNGPDQPGRRACGRRSDPRCRTGRVPAPHGAVHDAERRHAATRGPPTPSGTSRGHPGRVRGPERKPGPTALRFLRGWAVVDRPRVTRGTIDKWQRFLRCGISTRTGGHVMAERDRGHRRGPRQRGSHQHGPQRLQTALNSQPDNYRASGTAVSARSFDHGLCARVGCQRGQRQDAATPGCSSRRRSTERTRDGRTGVATLR